MPPEKFDYLLLRFLLILILWKGELGEAVVWYGAAAEIRVFSVTSLLEWAVTISANVNKLAASVGYDLVAPNPSHK